MNCPYCNHHFHLMFGVGRLPEKLPEVFPCVCTVCGEVFLLLEKDGVKKLSPADVAFLKTQPVWSIIEAAQQGVAHRKKAHNAVNN